MVRIEEEVNSDSIKRKLKASTLAVDFVAKLLEKDGWDVIVPKLRIAPSPDKINDYIDNGDIIATRNEITRRVEVKWSSQYFTGKDDWKFPNFLVYGKKAFDRANNPKIDWIIIVSHDFKAVAVVSAKTKDAWFSIKKQDKSDGRINYYQDFYFCPLECVRFVRIMKK